MRAARRAMEAFSFDSLELGKKPTTAEPTVEPPAAAPADEPPPLAAMFGISPYTRSMVWAIDPGSDFAQALHESITLTPFPRHSGPSHREAPRLPGPPAAAPATRPFSASRTGTPAASPAPGARPSSAPSKTRAALTASASAPILAAKDLDQQARAAPTGPARLAPDRGGARPAAVRAAELLPLPHRRRRCWKTRSASATPLATAATPAWRRV